MPGKRTGFVRKMARVKSRATLMRMGRKMFAMGNTTVGKEFMRAAGGRDPYVSRGGKASRRRTRSPRRATRRSRR